MNSPLPLSAPVDAAALRVEIAAIKAKLAAYMDRADSEAAHADSEAARADSEAARANNEAARAALQTKRAEAGYKLAFLVKFRSIGFHDSRATLSNIAETSGSEPPPTTVDLKEVFGHPYPGPSELETLANWKKFCANFKRGWVAPVGLKTDEDRDVQPVIHHMLDVLVKDELFVWWSEPTQEAKAKENVRPDFTVTHIRDSYPTLIGAAFTVEVKNPATSGKSSQYAGLQSLRRRLLQVFEECDLRGEPLDAINGFTVGTDGETLTVARMLSGAPSPGVTYEGCEPCPVKETGPLELLTGWDFFSPPTFSDTPPLGFKALAHLCSLPSPYLLGPSIVPLTSLRVRLEGVGEEGGGAALAAATAAGAGAGAATADAREVALILHSRLGCGGSSDTYECTLEGWGGVGSGSGSGSGSGRLVLKTPRTGTVGACYTRECAALLKLHAASTAAGSTGLVPTLHFWGSRASAQDWPVLLMTPVGVPIATWVEGKGARLGGGGGGGGGADAVQRAAVLLLRRQCAGEVCLRLLSALQLAHGLDLIHCDVRPENVVMACSSGSEGGGAADDAAAAAAVLVDWGISRKYTEAAQGAGVATYASRAVFVQGSYTARPLQDLVAVMYTWLSVAFSPNCKAPWGHVHMDSLTQDYDARDAWIATHCPRALWHINALHLSTLKMGRLHQLAEDAVIELSK